MAEAATHSLVSRGLVPGAKGVAELLALALNFLIKAALGRLFRRLARTADQAPLQPARPHVKDGGDQAKSQRHRTPTGQSTEPCKSRLSSLLPDDLRLSLRLVPLQNQAATPPIPKASRRPPAEPTDRTRPRWRWENLGRFRLGDPPGGPPEDRSTPAAAEAAAPKAAEPRRPSRLQNPTRTDPRLSRPEDAARRPRRPERQAVFSNPLRPTPLARPFCFYTETEWPSGGWRKRLSARRCLDG